MEVTTAIRAPDWRKWEGKEEEGEEEREHGKLNTLMTQELHMQ